MQKNLFLLTNTRGVLDKSGALLTDLTAKKMDTLIKNKTIHSGMLPKIKCAMSAVTHGVKQAHIIDGQKPHAVFAGGFHK